VPAELARNGDAGFSHLRRYIAHETETTDASKAADQLGLPHHSRMAEPGSASPLLADLGARLDHVGQGGVPLTDTGRLRMADVRAINERFGQLV
jgi:hypothetical protein